MKDGRAMLEKTKVGMATGLWPLATPINIVMGLRDREPGFN